MVDMLIADPMGSMMKGFQTAAAFQGQQNSNALAGYRTREAGRSEMWNNALSAYGKGAFAGDPNALAALYNVDPQKAWELQGDITDRRRKDVEWGRRNEEYDAAQEERQRDEAFRNTVGELVPGVLAGEGVKITEELAKLNPEGAMQLARVASEIAANKSKAELEAETADMERILKGASVFYANKDQEGYNAFLRENADKLTEWGRSPEDFPFQSFPAYAAEFGAVTEFLRAEVDRSRPDPLTKEGKRQADIEAGYIDPNSPTSGADMSESERRLFIFSEMQRDMAPEINAIEDAGYDPTNAPDRYSDGVIAGNWLKTGEGQRYDAAANAWAEAALRIATGAAATPEEHKRIRNTYFAQPGDKPETTRFKRQLREQYSAVLQAALNGGVPPVAPEKFAEAAADNAPSGAPAKPPVGDGSPGSELFEKYLATDPAEQQDYLNSLSLDELMAINEEQKRRAENGGN